MRIEDYRETLRGHRVLHLVDKGAQPGRHAAYDLGQPRLGGPSQKEPTDYWGCGPLREVRPRDELLATGRLATPPQAPVVAILC